MKLKYIVAMMGVLGVISSQVYATEASATADNAAATSGTKAMSDTKDASSSKHAHKHSHHNKARHHHARHHMMRGEGRESARFEAREEKMEKSRVSFKDEMPASVCSISESMMIMDVTTQNMGRAMPNVCNPGWYNRVQMSGGMNFDTKFGNRNGNFVGENYRRFSLNDAYLNITADVNEWINAFMSLSYSDASYGTSLYSGYYGSGLVSSGYSNFEYDYSNVYNNGELDLEQAYFVVGNLNQYPVYLQLGKFFQDYGRYQIHPITRSFTQSLTETLATAAKLGYISDFGLHGSVAFFDNTLSKYSTSSNHKVVDWALSVGYERPGSNFGWDAGVGYINNMVGVDDVAHGVGLFTYNGYHHAVAGGSLYADVNSGPFSLNARIAGSLKKFNAMDLPKNGFAGFNTSSGTVFANTTGARPMAWGLAGNYSFDPWNRIYTATLGFESSTESAGLGLPESRIVAALGCEVLKNTNVTLEWDHDKDYSTSRGGNGGDESNVVSIRAGVQFG